MADPNQQHRQAAAADGRQPQRGQQTGGRDTDMPQAATAGVGAFQSPTASPASAATRARIASGAAASSSRSLDFPSPRRCGNCEANMLSFLHCHMEFHQLRREIRVPCTCALQPWCRLASKRAACAHARKLVSSCLRTCISAGAGGMEWSTAIASFPRAQHRRAGTSRRWTASRQPQSPRASPTARSASAWRTHSIFGVGSSVLDA